MLRSAFAGVAAIVVIVALAILAPRLVNSLTTLHLAVEGGGDDAALAHGLAEAVSSSSAGLRLRVIEAPDPRAAGRALEDGRADLAVVRGDAALPANGMTVLVFHHDAAIVFSAPGRKLKSLADLARKRVAILPMTPENVATFDAILGEYSIRPSDVERLQLGVDDIAAAIAAKRIDAVVAIGPPGSSATAAVLAAMHAGGKGEIEIAEAPGAEGIAARRARYRKVELPSGYFGGAPLLPADDISVLGFDYLLQARGNLDETIVSNLTGALFESRRRVMANLPAAARLEKPDEEKTSVRALHPGAAAYYGDNAKTFMDRYGDWFYIGAMLLGGVGSALAGLLSLGHARGRQEALGLLDDLVAIKERASASRELRELDEFDKQVEKLSSRGLQFARERYFDEAGIASLRLAIDETRRAIADQRAAIAIVGGNVAVLRPADAATSQRTGAPAA